MAQVITAKYAPATNTKGSRIKVTSWMGTTYTSWGCAMNTQENYLNAIDEHIKRKLATNGLSWAVLAIGENVDGCGKSAIVESVKDAAYSVSALQWDVEHYGA